LAQKWPSLHAVSRVASAAQWWPSLHAVSRVEPRGQKERGEQRAHVALLVRFRAAEYAPAGHGVDVVGSGQ